MLVSADHSLASLMQLGQQAKSALGNLLSTQDKHHKELLPLLDANLSRTDAQHSQTRTEGLSTGERLRTGITQLVQQTATEQREAGERLTGDIRTVALDVKTIKSKQTTLMERVEGVEKKVDGVERKLDKMTELLKEIEKRLPKFYG
jgi:predicted  nucleic acid-binding Zn-ribbon protein